MECPVPVLLVVGYKWRAFHPFGISSHTSACFPLEWSEREQIETYIPKFQCQATCKVEPKTMLRSACMLWVSDISKSCGAADAIEVKTLTTRREFAWNKSNHKLDLYHLLWQFCLPIKNKISQLPSAIPSIGLCCLNKKQTKKRKKSTTPLWKIVTSKSHLTISSN